MLAPRGVDVGEEELLELYARHEAELEAGPYLAYRDVVAGSLRRLAAELGHEVSDEEATGFAAAVGDWPAFPDTAASLRHLQGRFRLGVITNCDRDLFAGSNLRLGVTLDWVVTAEDAGAYKPSLAPFELAFATLDVPRERDPPCGSEPLSRPRAGQGARAHDRLGRPPARPRGIRRDAGGGGRARPDRSGHGQPGRVGCGRGVLTSL